MNFLEKNKKWSWLILICLVILIWPEMSQAGVVGDATSKVGGFLSDQLFGSATYIASSILGSITEGLTQIILFGIEILGKISSVVLGLLSSLLDLSILLNGTVTKSRFVLTGWLISRDIANLFMTVGLLYVAFRFMLGLGSDFKQTGLFFGVVFKIITTVILVNFGLAFAGMAIDASNLVTNFFIKKATSDVSSGLVARSFSAQLISAINPQGLLQIKPPGEVDYKGLGQPNENTFSVLASGFITIFLTMIAIITILIITFFFFIRFIALTVMLSIMPLFQVTGVLGAAKLNSVTGGFSETFSMQTWWKDFMKWMVFAPQVAFFFYLSLIFMRNIGSDPSSFVWANFTKAISNSEYLKGTALVMEHAAGVFGQIIVSTALLTYGIYFAYKNSEGFGLKFTQFLNAPLKNGIKRIAGERLSGGPVFNPLSGAGRATTGTIAAATGAVGRFSGKEGFLNKGLKGIGQYLTRSPIGRGLGGAILSGASAGEKGVTDKYGKDVEEYLKNSGISTVKGDALLGWNDSMSDVIKGAKISQILGDDKKAGELLDQMTDDQIVNYLKLADKYGLKNAGGKVMDQILSYRPDLALALGKKPEDIIKDVEKSRLRPKALENDSVLASLQASKLRAALDKATNRDRGAMRQLITQKTAELQAKATRSIEENKRLSNLERLTNEIAVYDKQKIDAYTRENLENLDDARLQSWSDPDNELSSKAVLVERIRRGIEDPAQSFSTNDLSKLDLIHPERDAALVSELMRARPDLAYDLKPDPTKNRDQVIREAVRRIKPKKIDEIDPEILVKADVVKNLGMGQINALQRNADQTTKDRIVAEATRIKTDHATRNAALAAIPANAAQKKIHTDMMSDMDKIVAGLS